MLRVAGAVFVFIAFILSCTELPPEPKGKPEPAVAPVQPKAEVPAEPTVQPLVVWIEAEPEEGKAPLEVQFTARLKGGTLPHKVLWVFGDDSEPTSELNPIHTYAKPGTYFVEITAEDAGGDDDDDDMEILVE
jgi:PKD repeat protein